MKLIIVESPKKCETITRYLGEDYLVMASEGHIRDLSTRGKGGLGIDIDSGFVPHWEVSKRKFAVIKKLKEAMKQADEVYLATDPDREGEAISWHLADVLGLNLETTKRLRFHEITKPAILEALESPSCVDMNLVQAQEARRMEDRIIGFMVSTLMKRKIGERSAGRVQSATLAMIVQRQKEIDAFVPEEYWVIEAKVRINGKEYKITLNKVDGQPFKCTSEAEAKAILARMPERLTISNIAKKEVVTNPKPVFKTSSLQQEAFARFHFSNTKTQAVAQKLYEGLTVNGEHVGLITYMRTDSTRISPNFYTKHAKPYILEVYGEEYLGTLPVAKKTGNMQDAHEGIRPTGTHRTPEVVAKYVSPDEAKLYRLIYCRAMASMMTPKRSERTTLTLSGNGLDFSLSGSRTLFKGFSVIYGEFDEEDPSALPSDINLGDEIEVISIDPQQKFTKPEPQYNEASIVKAMEENGIGRPSTYATTIDTLLKRKYVISNKGVLNPSENGIKAVAWLEEFFPEIVSTDYTANMEVKLDKVEQGELTCVSAMDDFYHPFTETYAHAKTKISTMDATNNQTGEMCPECGRPLIIRRNSKGQEFVGCSGFPSCKYIKKEEASYVGRPCPLCGHELVYKKNRKGDSFIGCSNYPECRYTANKDGTVIEKKEKKVYTEADYLKPCPTCKNGFLVIKEGKRAKFIGCTNFPKCRHVEWLNKKEKNEGE